MPGRVVVDKVIQYRWHPWSDIMKPATANGVQYAASTNSAVDATWYSAGGEVNTHWFNDGTSGGSAYPGNRGLLKEAAFGIVVAFKAANGDCIVNWKVQGKVVNALSPTGAVSWVDISDTLTQTRPVNTVFVDNQVSGYAPIAANCNALPLELRVVFQANTDALVEAKVKNSSYFDVAYTLI